MSRSMRYKNATVCDHLASQYVAGAMSARVRRRMETLMRDYREMDTAVAYWSDLMTPMQDRLPPQQPPVDLWAKIDAATAPVAKPQTARTQAQVAKTSWLASFWENLAMWRFSAMAGTAASVVFAVALLWNVMGGAPGRGADYMAPMSRNGEVALVISAYKGEEPGTSELVTQWSKRFQDKPSGPLHLWAEKMDDHSLVYLGQIDSGKENWTLTSAEWKVIANSSRLLINDNPSTLDVAAVTFEGPCVQLNAWKS
ncbi:hypothetical protein O5O45_13995 [Hahella aquimaris]|uniref:hypothetical protein n=1 Tax=Hahella sp. HNIBRBA332 TaxID=3015983 RepID=UPI00273B4C16|nr:hypothetical protein [Hahella sp. HNIBRBA332]WLQ17027.1 hypothetical protein O5O45_13995 [Hahella sp. HNIBRBA332]